MTTITDMARLSGLLRVDCTFIVLVHISGKVCMTHCACLHSALVVWLDGATQNHHHFPPLLLVLVSPRTRPPSIPPLSMGEYQTAFWRRGV